MNNFSLFATSVNTKTKCYFVGRNIEKYIIWYNFIPLYNIYSTYIEIRLVETIPRDIYQNIVFLSQ